MAAPPSPLPAIAAAPAQHLAEHGAQLLAGAVVATIGQQLLHLLLDLLLVQVPAVGILDACARRGVWGTCGDGVKVSPPFLSSFPPTPICPPPSVYFDPNQSPCPPNNGVNTTNSPFTYHPPSTHPNTPPSTHRCPQLSIYLPSPSSRGSRRLLACLSSVPHRTPPESTYPSCPPPTHTQACSCDLGAPRG